MQPTNKDNSSNNSKSENFDPKGLFERFRNKRTTDHSVKAEAEVANNSNLLAGDRFDESSKKVRFEDTSSAKVDSNSSVKSMIKRVFNSSHHNNFSFSASASSTSSHSNHFNYTYDDDYDDPPSSSGARNAVSVFTEKRYQNFDEDRDLSSKSIKEKDKYYRKLQDITNTILDDDCTLNEHYDDSIESDNEQEDDEQVGEDDDDNDYDDDTKINSSKKHCTAPFMRLQNMSYCPTCNTRIKRNPKAISGKKRSDEDLKRTVLSLTIEDMMSFKCQTDTGLGCKQNGINN